MFESTNWISGQISGNMARFVSLPLLLLKGHPGSAGGFRKIDLMLRLRIYNEKELAASTLT
jgi:hypothetical protein